MRHLRVALFLVSLSFFCCLFIACSPFLIVFMGEGKGGASQISSSTVARRVGASC